MPIYDYICNSCAHKFEEFNPYMNDDPTECPKCGSSANRVQHFHDQKLKRPDYIPPPKASRKFGESRITPHQRKKWC